VEYKAHRSAHHEPSPFFFKTDPSVASHTQLAKRRDLLAIAQHFHGGCASRRASKIQRAAAGFLRRFQLRATEHALTNFTRQQRQHWLQLASVSLGGLQA